MFRTTGYTKEDTTTAFSDTEKFPKVVRVNGEFIVLKNLADQNEYTVSGNETDVFVPLNEIPISYGVDYGGIIFISRPGQQNYIFKSPLPPPEVVSTSLTVNNPTLEWKNSYRIPTTVYRNEIYTTLPLSEFNLIAEVDGYTVSGGTSSFTDLGINLGGGQSIDYILKTEHGQTDLITITNNE